MVVMKVMGCGSMVVVRSCNGRVTVTLWDEGV